MKRRVLDSAKNIRAAFSFACIFVCLVSINNVVLAENRIDTQRYDAPELAAYGKYSIGVRTLKVVNPKQINILELNANQPKPTPLPIYDRPLTLEVWYPAIKESSGDTVLNAYIRDGKQLVELHGKAVRNAKPTGDSTRFPLVIISHGYPGNRFLMAHLAENIASKGYVVVSIDHTDSTYRTQAAFASTLVNRPLDQLFVLEKIAQLSKDKTSFLYELVDANNTALIGYSMGGYGALINAGAGLTEQAVKSDQGVPFGILAQHQSGVKGDVDERIKTVVAFAPWGMNYHMFSNETLQGVKVPMMLVAGSQDDVSGYENGVRAIWKGITKVERVLLTFENANHNAGAVMPAPEESYVFDQVLGINVSMHYLDAVWDNTRMNNIAQHFVSAWLAKYLKGDADMHSYFDLVPNSNDGVWSMDNDGKPTAQHTYWKGFAPRSAKGLRLEYLPLAH